MFRLIKKILPKQRGTQAGLAVATVAAVAWLAFGFFGIQAAFIDNKVNEANPFASLASAPAEVAVDASAPGEIAQPLVDAVPAPTASDDVEDDVDANVDVDAETASPAAEAPVEQAAPAEVPSEPAVPQIITLASGTLVDHAHAGEGTINVLTDGNQRFLRFEDDFAIDNGPDLNVYLVRGADAEGDPGLFDDDFIDLGDLKGNIGAQNYELPADVDLDEYDTVVIWCVRFGVAFNAANLS